jgi:hypothetical protein
MRNFKQCFEYLKFNVILESDFCLMLTDNIRQYLLHRSDSEIKCIDLYSFNYIKLSELIYLYNLDRDIVSETEEYKIDNSITRDKLLAYIFALKEQNTDIALVKGDLYKTTEGNHALILRDKDNNIKNRIAFSEDGDIHNLINKNAVFISENESENALITCEPDGMIDFMKRYGEQYKYYCLMDGTSQFYIDGIISKDFKLYTFLCSSTRSYACALQTLASYISSKKQQMQFHSSPHDCRGELIISLDPDQEVLEYLQFSSDITKKIRTTYFNGEMTNLEIIKINKMAKSGINRIYLSFNICIAEISIIIEALIKKYDLPFNVIKHE